MQPTEESQTPLERLLEIQETIEQQLDEIQDILTAINQKQTYFDTALRNTNADLKLIKQALNIP
jgi:hypothetical protein